MKHNYFDFNTSNLLLPLQTKFAEITITSAAVPVINKILGILLAHFHTSPWPMTYTVCCHLKKKCPKCNPWGLRLTNGRCGLQSWIWSHRSIYPYIQWIQVWHRSLFFADAAEKNNDFIKLHLLCNFNSSLVASLFALEALKDGRL